LHDSRKRCTSSTGWTTRSLSVMVAAKWEKCTRRYSTAITSPGSHQKPCTFVSVAGRSYMTELSYFGVVQAEIIHDQEKVVLTVKRAAIPVGSGTVRNLRDWAVATMTDDYPTYRIEDLTNGHK